MYDHVIQGAAAHMTKDTGAALQFSRNTKQFSRNTKQFSRITKHKTGFTKNETVFTKNKTVFTKHQTVFTKHFFFAIQIATQTVYEIKNVNNLDTSFSQYSAEN